MNTEQNTYSAACKRGGPQRTVLLPRDRSLRLIVRLNVLHPASSLDMVFETHVTTSEDIRY